MSYNSPFRNIATIRLGDFIERSTTNNHNLEYGVELIEGVTNEGMFAEPKGSTLDIDLKPYKIVNNGAFVYNPSRLNLGSIAYRTNGMCIVSHLYIVFYLNDCGKEIIDPEYLFMYFRRNEFYREVTFRNFGSQRPEFNFVDMSNIHIPLPPLPVQQKYVAIYKAMQANQQSYERGLEDLRLVCESYIDKLRNELPHERIGDYIALSEECNDEGLYTLENVRGVSIEKRFIETKADMQGVNLKPYYVVYPDAFAYVTVTSRNGEKISLAHNASKDTYICSSSYVVFNCTNTEKLLPRYLRIFFVRSEFNRYARYNSWGSARETFDFSEMQDVRIPIPDITVQTALAELFDTYLVRRAINEKLKKQLSAMCPILIRGSLSDGG